MNDKELQEIRREHEIFKQECEDWDNYVKNQNRIQLFIFISEKYFSNADNDL
jgi:hypothetical protein